MLGETLCLFDLLLSLWPRMAYRMRTCGRFCGFLDAWDVSLVLENGWGFLLSFWVDGLGGFLVV